MVELDNVDDVDDTLDADNLDLEKKNIGSLAQTNMFPKGHKLTFGKRTNIDESDATDDGKYLLKKIMRIVELLDIFFFHIFSSRCARILKVEKYEILSQ